MQGMKPLSVSQITGVIKTTLESSLGEVAVEGEVSNFRPAGSGHLYFTLKDEDSQIQAVMFRGDAVRLGFKPADGQMVTVHGRVTVYAKRGNYQIICTAMQRSGVGRLLQMLEERKQALAIEGLFDADRKKRLPVFPTKVAVVTSATGAALRDFLQVVGRRNAGLHVIIVPTVVQGDTAAADIAAAVHYADRHRLGEVIIVTRGGGSIEDLLAFSEESVVRAVADSETPVISAVGHEIDTALCDLAADYRAPTPSAAAEIVTAQREDLHRHVLETARTLIHAFTARLSRAQLLLRRFSGTELEQQFRILSQPYLQRLDDAKDDLVRGITDILKAGRNRHNLAERELAACSPFEVLGRGYSIVRVVEANTKSVLRSAADVKPGTQLDVQPAEGLLRAEVLENSKLPSKASESVRQHPQKGEPPK